MAKIHNCSTLSSLSASNGNIDGESHILFHLLSKKDSRTDYYVTFASRRTAAAVSSVILSKGVEGCVHLLQHSKMLNPQHRCLTGKTFENLAHLLIVQGKTFTSRQVGVKGETNWSLKGYTRCDFHELTSEMLEPNVYYVPINEYSASFDSFVKRASKFLVFQMTIQKYHLISPVGFVKLQKQLKIPLAVDYYFVLPKNIYNHCYKKPKPINVHNVTITQFCLCVDFEDRQMMKIDQDRT